MKYDVLLCTYNGEKFIKEQLNSILEQSILPSKIYIGDDKSTDNTVQILLDTLNKSSVDFEVEINPTRLGYAKNFMNQAKKAKSELVFFSDQDDVWIKDKAESILTKFNESKKVSLVFTNAQLVDSNLNSLNLTMWDLLSVSDKTLLDYRHTFLRKNIVTGATMAVKRNILHNLTSLPNDVPHDYWLASVCSMKSSIASLKECHILYRQHDNNVLGAKKRGFGTKLLSLYNKDSLLVRKKNIRIRLNILKQAIKLKQISNDDYAKELAYLNFVDQLINHKNVSVYSFLCNFKDYNRFDNGCKYFFMDLFICCTNT